MRCRLSANSDGEARPRAGDDDDPLCNTRHLPTAGSTQPVRESKLDRFHGMVESVQALRDLIPRRELVGVAFFVVIGVALIALAPAKQTVEKTSVVTV